MATMNPFDLLGDDDTEDPSLLVAAMQQKMEPKKSLAASAPVDKKGTAKLPSKPLPPAQAVRESARGVRGGGRGRGTGGESYRDSSYNEGSYASREVSFGQGASGESDAVRGTERRGGYGGSRGAYRGGQRGGFANGRVDSYRDQARPHKNHERHSGTGRGYDIKREGAGVGNWGTPSDELAPVTGEVTEVEKKLDVEKAATDGDKEPAVATEVEEKEPEPEEMTLEEYEKVLEEKRKALQALKTEERKVDGKEFETMKPLPSKKTNDDIFAKLGSEKDKKKELAEKAKTTVSINEFLKPAEGERSHGGGRGRGRGRNSRGGNSGGTEETKPYRAPYVEDQSQFPTLGGK